MPLPSCCDCHHPAADARHCRLPSATGKPGKIRGLRNQRQAFLAHSGGHGGAACPGNRRGYGLLSDTAAEPEPASESVDETIEVVNGSLTSPSSGSSAAAALAAAQALSRTQAAEAMRRCGRLAAPLIASHSRGSNGDPGSQQCQRGFSSGRVGSAVHGGIAACRWI
jgi:hypothetical protein